MLNIIGKRKIWLGVSGASFVLSLIFLALWGLNFGIDFTGGSLLEVEFLKERPALETIRGAVGELNVKEIVIQPAGEQNMIFRFSQADEQMHQNIISKLNEKFSDNVQEEKFESIGPSIGRELKTRAAYAVILVIIAIVLYVAWAFRKVSWPVQSWKYGISAIIALIHDVVLTLGVFSALGHFFNIEVGLPFVAALLTILGYSVNDTIIVFDRTRENLTRLSKIDFEGVVNRSVNETLARSINTTLTTELALIAVYFFGGDSIKYFAFALLIGIFFGAYSSIFVASPLLVVWERWKSGS